MRFRRVGRRALLVEVDDLASAQATYRLVRELADSAGQLAPPTDVVPAARTVLLDGVDPQAWQALLISVEGRHTVSGSEPAGEVVVPTRYDGPDLAVVAECWGCPVDEVAHRHQRAVFTVAFCGFAPGFAYCTSEPRLPVVARRAEPRTAVPAGAVALAAEYCGIYPREMPGGWQLIGSTDVAVFEPTRERPALLRPGDRVRFEAVP